jgi:predicted ATPase
VSGEPGVGKSRLAQALLERLLGEPHTGLRLLYSPHHQHDALYPTITQLERAAGSRREDNFEALLARATNHLGEAAPVLVAMLSLPTAERYSPLSLTPQKGKEKTLQALVDAQWRAPTSLTGCRLPL